MHVVPDPTKGSSTTSPGRLPRVMRYDMSASGCPSLHCVGPVRYRQSSVASPSWLAAAGPRRAGTPLKALPSGGARLLTGAARRPLRSAQGLD